MERRAIEEKKRQEMEQEKAKRQMEEAAQHRKKNAELMFGTSQVGGPTEAEIDAAFEAEFSQMELK